MQNYVKPENAQKSNSLLNEKVDEIRTIREKPHGLLYYNFVGFCSKIWSVIDEIYQADDTHSEEIRIVGLPTCSCNSQKEVQLMLLVVYQSSLLNYIDEIQNSMKTPE